MFLLFSISNGLEFWWANHTSIYEKSELKVFKNKSLLGEISNNWPKNYLEQMYTRLLNHDTFSTFSVILFLVPPSNFIVSCFESFR